MHPVLQHVSDAWAQELSGRDAAWCQLHPFGNVRQWSAQELIEHLVLTYKSTSLLLEERLEKRRPTRSHSTFTQWVLQICVLSLGRMPSGVPAPGNTRPGRLNWPPMTGEELAAKLSEGLQQMDTLLDQCRHRFGIQRVTSHFFFGPLRVDQWRRFHVVHGHHHLRQFRRLKRTAAPLPDTSHPAT
ncbi:DinB family protein [Paracidobacterium acidisoli]|nr:DinB family protein [Paracidobacterium acidisoli]MBT9329461.1 DinB family protein [Paracidobacterium acidisoli]